MNTIGVQVEFSAAHHHKGADEACQKIHGHNYRLEVRLSSPRLENGMVMDFRLVRSAAREAIKEWDHSLLNEIEDFKGMEPTTENISRVLYEKLSEKFSGEEARLEEVRVWEKWDCWASWRESR